MAEQFQQLEPKHEQFIGEQQMFFVGTAPAQGRVNVSPKGMDSFRIISPSRISWLNLTGSGNESAAHVLENGRMTIMFCSFGKQPLIMRLYGVARAVHPRDADWDALAALFPDHRGSRQIFEVDLEMVLTSCGYAVPQYEFTGQRPTLEKWTQNHSDEELLDYWRNRNARSLDGYDTGILPVPEDS